MKASSKNISKAFTKSCIMNALLQLMHTKDYERITKSELAEKVEVSRMAYYYSYSSKDAILTYYMYWILKEYSEELKAPAFQADFQSYEYILWNLKYLLKYKDYVLYLEKTTPRRFSSMVWICICSQ